MPKKSPASAELLVVNDDTAAAEMLMQAHGPVHIVMDDSGAELAGDLTLTLELLQRGVNVVLHLKVHPTYVSDTTVADFHHFVETACESEDSRVYSYGAALRQAFESGQITLAPDSYWYSTE